MTKKKGLHYRTKLYKLLLLKYYAISALAYASVSVVSLVSVIVCALDSQIVNTVIYGVTFAVSFTGAVIKCVAMGRSYTKRFILEQKEYKDKIIQSATQKMSNSHANSNYKWEKFGEQYFLYSPAVDDKLFERCKDLRIEVSPQKPEMDADQKEALYNIVSKKIAQGRSIFNSDMVRLRTDMLLGLFYGQPVIKSDCDGGAVKFASDRQIKDERGNRKNLYKEHAQNLVRLEKTDYFYNISTNDQIYSRIFKFDYSSSYSGRDKSLDEDDRLYDLSQSPSANIIGVTTFAITSDGYILLNLQGEMNDVNRGCIVPSGSGSADFKDLMECKPFEPKGLRGQVESLVNGNLRFTELDDERFPEVNSPKKFNKFKNAYLRELNGYVKTRQSSEDGETVEREYKNATVAKAEREQFKNYASKMKPYTYDFDTFLKYGMVRELIEESHLYETDGKANGNGVTTYRDVTPAMRKRLIDNTYVCGYIRILDRGGKPDFFGFTLLDETLQQVRDMFKYGRNSVLAVEIKGNYKVTDFNEVSDLKFAPFDKLYGYREDVKKFVQKECGLKEGEVKISLQTYCLLNLLCKDGPRRKITEFLSNKKKESK